MGGRRRGGESDDGAADDRMHRRSAERSMVTPVLLTLLGRREWVTMMARNRETRLERVIERRRVII